LENFEWTDTIAFWILVFLAWNSWNYPNWDTRRVIRGYSDIFGYPIGWNYPTFDNTYTQNKN
jgi:hypothetical protein